MYYKITYCSYIMALQVKEISFRDFLALLLGILRPAYTCPVLSKRRKSVACGVVYSVAERAV